MCEYGWNHQKKEEEGKTRKRKKEDSVFAGAVLIRTHILWKEDHHTYYLAQKRQWGVSISTSKYSRVQTPDRQLMF